MIEAQASVSCNIHASVPVAGIGFLQCLLFVAVAYRSNALSAIALLVCFGLISVSWRRFVVGHAAEKRLLILMAAVLTVTLQFAVWRSFTAIFHFWTVILTMGASFLVTREMGTYSKASGLTLVIVQSAILIYLTREGFTGFPLEDMLPDSSSNGITSYLIVLQVNYAVARYLAARKLTLVTSLLTLVICIVGYGRGSLVAASSILVVILFVYGFRGRPVRTLFVIVAMAASTLFVVRQYGMDIVSFIESNTKLGAGLLDQSRQTIAAEYVHKIDSFTLFTGANYAGTVIETDFSGNPHNSYIRAHHIFGLPYLLVSLLFPYLLIARVVPSLRQLFGLAMLGIMLIRAATEPILFPTLLDFFFFSVCFLIGQGGANSAAYRTGLLSAR